ncbi:TonB-dependent receptor [Mucilaginibacter sp. BJC16-A38]|uniref:TonB dependent receptor n=1 Tax=Mucilaginibacter phenanthrenivorans TaxID=1234842 RepID=UPI0021589C14|nr:TonB dependent receptor [Mucilaginibacter phenanthrenivorans]MCR8561196.1 TonB-dependent receptor [Mucilaginibacter phenanthrenivorans]
MKSMFRLLSIFSVIYIVSTSLIYGQCIIKGKVTDEKKLPMPSVSIRLKKLPDTILYKATSTDLSGNFTFNNLPQGSYTLEADLMGYLSVVKRGLTINPTDTVLDIGLLQLVPSAKMLGEVAITARTPLIEKQIDKTVVNVDQNIANTGTNVLELLKKLPGVQITPDGQITLNGKSGVNVIMDGKTTYLSADDLANLLTNTPSSDIQKIEIMTNPSAKYDAEGTGGIINIIRKKTTKSGFNGSLTAGFGLGPHYDRYNSSLVLNFKTNKYNLYLNNSYGYSKGFSTGNGVSDIMNNNALSSEQVSTNTGLTINKALNSSAGLDLYLSKRTILTLTGNVSERRYNNNLTSVMAFADSNRNKTGSEKFSALNLDKPLNFNTGVQLTHKLDTTGRQWSADIDYANYRYRPEQYNSGVNYNPSGSFLSQDNELIDESRTLHIFGIRADYVQPLPGNGKLETGLKSSYVKTFNNSIYYNQLDGQNVIDPALGDDDINTENINAAYINFNRQYHKLMVQAGLRAEQTVMKGQQLFTNASVDQNYFGLFPTLFLSYKLNDQNTFNFQFGRRTDRPDYHEYIPFRRPLSATISFQGNPNLKPDFNWHSELTWSWQNTFFITAAYDIDRNYMRTLYYLDSNKTTITRMPTNIQGAHSWNVNVSFNKELAKWFTTNTTVTIYQNSFNGSTVNGFSLDDPGFATIDLVTNNSFRCSDKLSMEADFEYESKRQFVGSIFGAYSILSLAVKQKLFHDQGSITINANNVLNTENRGVTDHYFNLNQYGYSYIYSRAIIVTFNYRFGSGKLTKTQSKSGSEEEQHRAGN